MEIRDRINRFSSWSEQEDALLRGLGTDPGARTRAARELGRSREAVDGRMGRLGLLPPRLKPRVS